MWYALCVAIGVGIGIGACAVLAIVWSLAGWASPDEDARPYRILRAGDENEPRRGRGG